MKVKSRELFWTSAGFLAGLFACCLWFGMAPTNNPRGAAGKVGSVFATLPLQRTGRVAPNEGFYTQRARIESSGDFRLGFGVPSADQLAHLESTRTLYIARWPQELRKPLISGPADDGEQLGPRMKPFGYPDHSIDLIDSRYQPDLRFNE